MYVSCHRLFRVLWLIAPLAGVPAAHAEPPPPGPIIPVPQVAAPSAAAVLGGMLFSDPSLSGDESRSCASCHDLRTNGASARRFDASPDGSPLDRNTPTVFNAALAWRQNWLGDARTLEDQANESLRSPRLMAADPPTVLARLAARRDLRARFVSAFGHGPDWSSLLGAIGAFERTLLTPDSRFDRWLSGDPRAITPEEQAGFGLFKSIGCAACHQGVDVGGNLFERKGIVDPEADDTQQMFRVPSLRNVAVTAPYFDDGSAATLSAAVHRMAAMQLGRNLSTAQVDSIVTFLRTLTGRYDGRPVAAAR